MEIGFHAEGRAEESVGRGVDEIPAQDHAAPVVVLDEDAGQTAVGDEWGGEFRVQAGDDAAFQHEPVQFDLQLLGVEMMGRERAGGELHGVSGGRRNDVDAVGNPLQPFDDFRRQPADDLPAQRGVHQRMPDADHAGGGDASEAVGLFDEDDPRAQPRGADGGECAGAATADDDDVRLVRYGRPPLLFRHEIH